MEELEEDSPALEEQEEDVPALEELEENVGLIQRPRPWQLGSWPRASLVMMSSLGLRR